MRLKDEPSCLGPVCKLKGMDFCSGCGCRIPPINGEAYCKVFGDWLEINNEKNNERTEDTKCDNKGPVKLGEDSGSC